MPALADERLRRVLAFHLREPTIVVFAFPVSPQIMKNGPALTFTVVLIVGFALSVADWVRRNQAPSETGVGLFPVAGSTRAQAAFDDGPTLAGTRLQDSPKDPALSPLPERRALASTRGGVIASSQSGAFPPAFTNGFEAPGGRFGTGSTASSTQVQPSRNGPTEFQTSSTGASSFAENPRPASLPLAFRQLSPEMAAANPQLAGAVEGLQQSFVNAVGGPDQDPNDPAYYNRWMAAQKDIDEKYRLLVGNQAFLIEQMKVNNQ